MKLAAVYNVWSDSSDLLKGSIDRIAPYVDLIVIVYQTTSNFGQFDDTCIHDINRINDKHIIKIKYEPVKSKGGLLNERAKRQIGIDDAKRLGCSHFILMDCDEYYQPDEFKAAKDWVIATRHKATYCDMWTYFLKPNIRLQIKDITQVPFICSMDSLPLGGKFGGVYADPTRKVKLNPSKAPITMHHLSWIRKDIWSKLNNSSAKDNLIKVKATIEHDIANAEKDMYSKFYNTPLELCDPII